MAKMKSFLMICGVLFIGFSLLAEELSPEMMYQEAYYKEIGARDPEAALKMYENILVRYSENRQLAAKTQLRIGECYEKLGKTEEAAKAFRKVIEQFPSEQEVVTKAKERYASLAKEGTLTAVIDNLRNSL